MFFYDPEAMESNSGWTYLFFFPLQIENNFEDKKALQVTWIFAFLVQYVRIRRCMACGINRKSSYTHIYIYIYNSDLFWNHKW